MMLGTLSNSNQSRRLENSTRAAVAAVRCQSRPMPVDREIKEQSEARACESGAMGSHPGVKPLLNSQTIPMQTRTAAKTTWLTVAMRIGLSSVGVPAHRVQASLYMPDANRRAR